MSLDAKGAAALALHRFGLGPRAGSIAAIASDPRGALLAELDQPGIGQIINPELLSAAKASAAAFNFRQERQARLIAQRKDEEERKASGMAAEGTEKPDAAPLPAAEAVPAQIFQREVKARFDAAFAPQIGFVERLVWFWSNHFCVSADTAAQRHKVRGARRPTRQMSSRGDREFDDRAVYAIGAEIWVGVREIVEHQIAAGLHFVGCDAGVAAGAFVGVIAVDVDPVEMVRREIARASPATRPDGSRRGCRSRQPDRAARHRCRSDAARLDRRRLRMCRANSPRYVPTSATRACFGKFFTSSLRDAHTRQSESSSGGIPIEGCPLVKR